MSRRKYSATASLEPFTERLLAEGGPRFRAEVDALYAEMMLENELVLLREKEGITQAEVARRLGVSQPVVARFESGSKKRRVELATIVRHAAALGYEFVASFKKMPVAKQARAQAASVQTATKRSKPVTGKGSVAARRSKSRSK